MKLTDIKSPYQGKTLGKAQINLLAKLESLGVQIGTIREVRANRFSGVTKELDPLAVALFDFVMETNTGFAPLSYRGQPVAVSYFDRARYLFLALWPDEYYDLLD